MITQDTPGLNFIEKDLTLLSHLKDYVNVYNVRKGKIFARSFEYGVITEGNLRVPASHNSAPLKDCS